MKFPSRIDGELLRLWPWQQHAEVQRGEIFLFLKPAPLIDDFTVHEGNLTRWATKGEQSNSGPHLEGLVKRNVAHGFVLFVGQLLLVRGIPAPTVEGIIEQQPGIQLCEVIGVNAREPERGCE